MAIIRDCNDDGFAGLGVTTRLDEDYGQPAVNKRHTMSHPPDEIPEIESPIKRRKPEVKASPVKSKKTKVYMLVSLDGNITVESGDKKIK